MPTTAERNADLIRGRTKIRPRIGIVLGSGLGNLGQSVEEAVSVSYDELEDFPIPAVSGHAGSLVVGRIGGEPVAIMAGRGHYYEQGDSGIMRTALETLKTLGVGDLVLTNAAGSLRDDLPPSAVMLITDHINFGNRNPMIGEPSDARFVGMNEAYDVGLRRLALKAADEAAVELHQGVYIWFSGPSFETPAEIRAARILGADAVGMSTVPEVILARFLGFRVLAFSVITNYGAGMTAVEPSHAETKEVAPLGGAKLAKILNQVLATWSMRGAAPRGTRR